MLEKKKTNVLIVFFPETKVKVFIAFRIFLRAAPIITITLQTKILKEINVFYFLEKTYSFRPFPDQLPAASNPDSTAAFMSTFSPSCLPGRLQKWCANYLNSWQGWYQNMTLSRQGH